MTFKELQNIFEENFGGTYLSDIAKEFNVSPQVVSNLKSRNKFPYKYIQILRKKIDELNLRSATITLNPFVNAFFAYLKCKELINDPDRLFYLDKPVKKEEQPISNVVVWLSLIYLFFLARAMVIHL